MQTLVIILTAAIVALMVFAIITFILPCERIAWMRNSVEAVFQKTFRERTALRYYLFQWPDSQQFAGAEGCHLIAPERSRLPGGEDPLHYDQTYLVPESLLDPSDRTGTRYKQTYEGVPADGTLLADYDGNYFVPVTVKNKR